MSAQPTLAGIRVLEQGTFITGPCAGMMLADLGADVIKIESPEGDPYRAYQGAQYSPHFQAYNRNKRSLALDMKLKGDRGPVGRGRCAPPGTESAPGVLLDQRLRIERSLFRSAKL